MIIFVKAHPVQQAMSAAATPADLNEPGLRRNPGEPGAEEAAAGEYSKPRLKWQGLTIAIENPAGSVRRGRNRHGVTWEVRMRYDYGEILGTMGVDGDPVDVIVGPNLEAPTVYVVHQRRVNDWENFDEDKCCVGFDSQEDAEQAFLSNYNDPRFLGPITAMPVAEFVAKVRATRDAPAMIKAVLFFKGFVGPYLRGGRVVNSRGYHGRNARPTPTPGQLSLFGSNTPLGPSPYKGKDPVASTGDLFDADEHGEMPPGRSAYRDTVTEPRDELIAEHERLVDVLNSPSHADDKAEAKKQAEELAEMKQGDDHPAPIPRSLLSMIPEDLRDEWKDLHRQQHELHHYELGQVREKLERHRSRRNKAQAALRESEAAVSSLKQAPIPDPAREAEAQKMVDRHHAEFTKLTREQDALVGQHQSLYERISKLGRAKEQISAGSGELDMDWAAMRRRPTSEQQEHEKSMLKRYREHYKEKDGARRSAGSGLMTKAIVFLPPRQS